MRKTARVASTLLVAGAATVAMTGIANAAPAAPPAPSPANDVLNTVIAGATTTLGAGVDLWTVGIGKAAGLLGWTP